MAYIIAAETLMGSDEFISKMKQAIKSAIPDYSEIEQWIVRSVILSDSSRVLSTAHFKSDAKSRLLAGFRTKIYSGCQKNVPIFKRFFLQPLMSQFRNSVILNIIMKSGIMP